MTAARTVLDDLPFCLVRATLAFRRLSDQTSRVVGLECPPPGMASVLHALDEEGDCAVHRLVEKTQLPNGTLTGLLDALERDGHIRRVDNPADGRSWIIRLTRRGQGICAKLRRRHRLVMGIFGEVLSEPEAAELGRLLEKLTERMRSPGAELNLAPPAARRALPAASRRRRRVARARA